MKITDFESRIVTMPLKNTLKKASADKTFFEEIKNFSFIYAKVITDEDIIGYGAQILYNPDMSAGWTRYAHKIIKPLLINKIKDPFYVNKFIEIYTNEPMGIQQMPLPCSVEMALWDIIGKRANMPLYKLWGATKDKVKAYASLQEPYPLLRKRDWGLFVKEVSDIGFKAVKLHIAAQWGGVEWKKIIEAVEGIREEVGEGIEIMIDAEKSWGKPIEFNLIDVINLANALEKLGVIFLEEPLQHLYNPDLSAQLCQAVNIDIAGGGAACRWQAYKNILEKGALDIVQPDIMFAGGLAEVRKIAFLAKSYGRTCIPHFWGPGIALAATLQLEGSIDSKYIEYNYHPPAWVPEARDAMLSEPIRVDKNGYVKIPEGPGLGVEVNEDIIAKYTVEKDGEIC
jgi:L-alanine-DL-glutamate epimerase-like enolase superfamily enzyme